MARNSARSSSQMPAAVKNASTRNSTPCTGLRAVITSTPDTSSTAPNSRKSQVSNIYCCLPIAGVLGPVAGDALLVAVTHREQHGLGVVQIPPLLAVVLDDARLDDRVDRAGLLAEAAEDALHQVDVVARGAARAVLPLLAFDMDRERRAHGLAQLAGDAALFAVRVAAQRVQAAHARAGGRLLLGELHRDLAREQVAPGELEAPEELDQQKAFEKIQQARHGQRFQGVCIQMPITAIHTRVSGMNTFQPRRMIWS